MAQVIYIECLANWREEQKILALASRPLTRQEAYWWLKQAREVGELPQINGEGPAIGGQNREPQALRRNSQGRV